MIIIIIEALVVYFINSWIQILGILGLLFVLLHIYIPNIAFNIQLCYGRADGI